MIGKRLRNLRKQNDMTLEDVSKKLKISKQTLQRYETGVIGNIPSDKIELLAEIYNVSPAYIMGWEDTSEDDIHTIAAHHDGNEWTEEELEEIEKFKEYVRMKRKLEKETKKDQK